MFQDVEIYQNIDILQFYGQELICKTCNYEEYFEFLPKTNRLKTIILTINDVEIKQHYFYKKEFTFHLVINNCVHREHLPFSSFEDIYNLQDLSKIENKINTWKLLK